MPNCTRCEASTKKKGLCPDCVAAEGDISLTSLHTMLQNVIQQNNEIIKSLEFTNGTVTELKTSVDEMKDSMATLTQRVEALEDSNRTLNSENTTLKQRLEIMDQRTLTSGNAIEISGVPIAPNENVNQVVIDLSKALNVTITEENIVSSFRQHRRSGYPNEPPKIIARLCQRHILEELLKQRRVRRNFSTRDLGFRDNEARTIHVYEALTPHFRRIYGAANKLRHDGVIKYLWVRNGNVFIRTKDGEQKKDVKSLDQLKNF